MNIIITGASKGIGIEITKNFLKQGNNVFAIARSKKQLESLKKNKGFSNLKIITADLTNKTELQNAIDYITTEITTIDTLINNAGYLVNKPFEQITEKDFDKSIALNLNVPFFLTQKLLPLLKAAKTPQVINIGSMGGYLGSAKFSGLSIYSVTKGALATLTECLSEELSQNNIKFNCLALGAVQTEMLSKAFPDYQAPITASEMGEYIFHFATTTSRFMNGKVIPLSLTIP